MKNYLEKVMDEKQFKKHFLNEEKVYTEREYR